MDLQWIRTCDPTSMTRALIYLVLYNRVSQKYKNAFISFNLPMWENQTYLQYFL